jgi:hypothetical protein
MPDETGLPFDANPLFSYLPSIWATSYADKDVIAKFYEAMVRLADAEYAGLFQIDDAKDLSSTPISTYYPVVYEALDNWQSYGLPHVHYYQWFDWPTASADGRYRIRIDGHFLQGAPQVFLDGRAVPSYFFSIDLSPWLVDDVPVNGTTLVFDPVLVNSILNGTNTQYPGTGITNQQWTTLADVQRIAVFGYKDAKSIRATSDGETESYLFSIDTAAAEIDSVLAKLVIESVSVDRFIQIGTTSTGYELSLLPSTTIGHGNTLRVTFSDTSVQYIEVPAEFETISVDVDDLSNTISALDLMVFFTVCPKSLSFSDDGMEVFLDTDTPFYSGSTVRVRDAAGVQSVDVAVATNKIKLSRAADVNTAEVLFLGTNLLGVSVDEDTVTWDRPLTTGTVFQVLAPVHDLHDHAAYRVTTTAATQIVQVPITRPFMLTIEMAADVEHPVQIFVNGVLEDSSKYVFSDSRTVLFTEAIPLGSVVDFFYADMEEGEAHKHIVAEVAVAVGVTEQYSADLGEAVEPERYEVQIFDDSVLRHDTDEYSVISNRYVTFDEPLDEGTLVILHAVSRDNKYYHDLPDRTDIDYGYSGRLTTAAYLQDKIDDPDVQLNYGETFTLTNTGEGTRLAADSIISGGWFFDCAVDEGILYANWGRQIGFESTSSATYRRALSAIYAAYRGPSFTDSLVNYGSILLGSAFLPQTGLSRGITVDEDGAPVVTIEQADGEVISLSLINNAPTRIIDPPTRMPRFHAVNQLITVDDSTLDLPWLAYMAEDVAVDYKYASRLDVSRPSTFTSKPTSYDADSSLIKDYSVSFTDKEVRVGDLIRLNIAAAGIVEPENVATQYSVVLEVVDDNTIRVPLELSKIITAYGDLGYGEAGFGGSLVNPQVQSYTIWTRVTRPLDKYLRLDEALDESTALMSGETIQLINTELASRLSSFCFSAKLNWENHDDSVALEGFGIFLTTFKPADTHGFIYTEAFEDTPLEDSITATIDSAKHNLLAEHGDLLLWDGEATVSEDEAAGPFTGTYADLLTDDDLTAAETKYWEVPAEQLVEDGVYEFTLYAKIGDTTTEQSELIVHDYGTTPEVKCTATLNWSTGTLTSVTTGSPATSTATWVTSGAYRYVTIRLSVSGLYPLRITLTPSVVPTLGAILVFGKRLVKYDQEEIEQVRFGDSYFTSQSHIGGDLMYPTSENDYLYNPANHIFGATLAAQTTDVVPSPTDGDLFLIASQGYLLRTSTTIEPTTDNVFIVSGFARVHTTTPSFPNGYLQITLKSGTSLPSGFAVGSLVDFTEGTHEDDAQFQAGGEYDWIRTVIQSDFFPQVAALAFTSYGYALSFQWDVRWGANLSTAYLLVTFPNPDANWWAVTTQLTSRVSDSIFSQVFDDETGLEDLVVAAGTNSFGVKEYSVAPGVENRTGQALGFTGDRKLRIAAEAASASQYEGDGNTFAILSTRAVGPEKAPVGASWSGTEEFPYGYLAITLDSTLLALPPGYGVDSVFEHSSNFTAGLFSSGAPLEWISLFIDSGPHTVDGVLDSGTTVELRYHWDVDTFGPLSTSSYILDDDDVFLALGQQTLQQSAFQYLEGNPYSAQMWVQLTAGEYSVGASPHIAGFDDGSTRSLSAGIIVDGTDQCRMYFNGIGANQYTYAEQSSGDFLPIGSPFLLTLQYFLYGGYWHTAIVVNDAIVAISDPVGTGATLADTVVPTLADPYRYYVGGAADTSPLNTGTGLVGWLQQVSIGLTKESTVAEAATAYASGVGVFNGPMGVSVQGTVLAPQDTTVLLHTTLSSASAVITDYSGNAFKATKLGASPTIDWRVPGHISDPFPREGDTHDISLEGFYVSNGVVETVESVVDQITYDDGDNPLGLISGPGIPQDTPGVFRVGELIYTIPDVWLSWQDGVWTQPDANPLSLGASVELDDNTLFLGMDSPTAPDSSGTSYPGLLSDITLSTSSLSMKMEAHNSGAITELTHSGTHLINSLNKGRQAQFCLDIADTLGTRKLTEAGYAVTLLAGSPESNLITSRDFTTSTGYDVFTKSYMAYSAVFDGACCSETTISKYTTANFNDLPGVTRLAAEFNLETATRQAGGLRWSYQLAATDIFTDVYLFDTSEMSSASLQDLSGNTQGFLDSDFVGGVILSNAAKSEAIGLFRLAKPIPDGTRATIVDLVAAAGAGSKTGADYSSVIDYEMYQEGTASGEHALERYLVAGTLASVEQDFRALHQYFGGLAPIVEPATYIEISVAPSSVAVEETFTVIAVALNDSGIVDPLYTTTATLDVMVGEGTFTGTTEVAFVAGTVTFTNVSLATAEVATIRVATADLAPGLSSISVLNPVPLISTIVPATVSTGSSDLSLAITGLQFVADSVVRADGVDMTSVYGSPTAVTATIPSALLIQAANIGISVWTPPPGGGTTQTLTLQVLGGSQAVADSLLFIGEDTSPKVLLGDSYSTVVAGVDSTLNNIVDTQFNDPVALSKYSGPGTISGGLVTTASSGLATFSNVLFSIAGDYELLATSSSLATDTSNSIYVYNPTAIITSLVPSEVPLGDANQLISIYGQNFKSGDSVAYFDGAARTTTYVSATQLAMALTTADFVAMGAYPVTVKQTTGLSGNISNALSFDVASPTQSPATAIDIYSAPDAAVEDSEFTLELAAINPSGLTDTTHTGTVTVVMSPGTGVLTGSLSGSGTGSGPWASGLATFVGSVDTPGVKTFVVTDDQGLTQDTCDITIGFKVPVLTSMSPDYIDVTAGAAAHYGTVLHVFGANFGSPSEIQIAGATMGTTTLVSPAELTAVIPSPVIDSPELYAVSVFTDSPGGGLSGSQLLEIYTSPPPPPIVADSIAFFTATNQTEVYVGDTVTFYAAGIDSDWDDGSGPRPMLDTTVTGNIHLDLYSGDPSPAFAPSFPLSDSPDPYALYSGSFTSYGRAVFQLIHSPVTGATLPTLISSPATALCLVPYIDARYRTPVISSISPETSNAGDSGFTLAVTGTSFYSPAVVLWNGSERVTTYVSSTELTAVITDTDLVLAGVATVTIYNQYCKVGEEYSNPIGYPILVDGMSPPTADSEEALTTTIRVTRSSWQRLQPSISSVVATTAGFGLHEALRNVGTATNGNPIHDWNSYAGATEVIEIDAGLYEHIEFGTSSSQNNVDIPYAAKDVQHPIILRAKKTAGISEAVVINRQPLAAYGTTINVNSGAPENRHIHWFDIFFRPSATNCINNYPIDSVEEDQSLNDWKFYRCDAVGEWDHRAIELVPGRWLIGAVSSAQSQWGADGLALTPKDWLLDDVHRAWCGYMPSPLVFPEYNEDVRQTPHSLYGVKAGSSFRLISALPANNEDMIRDGIKDNPLYELDPAVNNTLGLPASVSLSSTDQIECTMTWLSGSVDGDINTATVSTDSTTITLGGSMTVPVVGGVPELSPLTVSNRGDYFFEMVFAETAGTLLSTSTNVTTDSGRITLQIKATEYGMGAVADRLTVTSRGSDVWFVGPQSGTTGMTEYMSMLFQARDASGVVDTSVDGLLTAAVTAQPAAPTKATLSMQKWAAGTQINTGSGIHTFTDGAISFSISNPIGLPAYWVAGELFSFVINALSSATQTAVNMASQLGWVQSVADDTVDLYAVIVDAGDTVSTVFIDWRPATYGDQTIGLDSATFITGDDVVVASAPPSFIVTGASKSMDQGVSYLNRLLLFTTTDYNALAFYQDYPTGADVTLTFEVAAASLSASASYKILPQGFPDTSPRDPSFSATASFPENSRYESGWMPVGQSYDWNTYCAKAQSQGWKESYAYRGLGRRFFPGYPGSPGHPNYSHAYETLWPSPGECPGLEYTGGVRTKWGLFLNETNNVHWSGGTISNIALEHGAYVHNVVGNGFALTNVDIANCGRCGIQVTGRRSENQPIPAGASSSHSGGPNRGLLMIKNNIFRDVGLVDGTVAITVAGHPSVVEVANNVYLGAFNTELAHILSFATGAITIWDGPQFSGATGAEQIDHYYTKLVDVAGVPLISQDDFTKFWTTGHICGYPHPGVPPSQQRLVCAYPYLPDQSPGNYTPPVFDIGNGTDTTTYNAGPYTYGSYHQNGSINIENNQFIVNQGDDPDAGAEPYSVPIPNRNPYSCATYGTGYNLKSLMSLGGIRDLSITGNLLVNGKNDHAIALDPYSGTQHISTPNWLLSGGGNVVVGTIVDFTDQSPAAKIALLTS